MKNLNFAGVSHQFWLSALNYAGGRGGLLYTSKTWLLWGWGGVGWGVLRGWVCSFRRPPPHILDPPLPVTMSLESFWRLMRPKWTQRSFAFFSSERKRMQRKLRSLQMNAKERFYAFLWVFLRFTFIFWVFFEPKMSLLVILANFDTPNERNVRLRSFQVNAKERRERCVHFKWRQKNAENVAFTSSERKRTQRTFRSLEKNVCPTLENTQ